MARSPFRMTKPNREGRSPNKIVAHLLLLDWSILKVAYVHNIFNNHHFYTVFIQQVLLKLSKFLGALSANEVTFIR